jgi:hypothetical protein
MIRAGKGEFKSPEAKKERDMSREQGKKYEQDQRKERYMSSRV